MKHLILKFTYIFLLLNFLFVSAYPQRSVKDFKRMAKNSVESKAIKMGYLGSGFVIKPCRFTSLNNVDSSVLNTKETNLLLQYKDVLICDQKGTFHHCYYVIDSIVTIALNRYHA